MIKALMFIMTLFVTGSAFSQSNLPACQGGNTASWSNCWGTFTFPGGDRIVSEYQNGMRNGQGIEYAKNGSVLRSGTWKNDQLVSSYGLDKGRFPFDPQALTVATNNQSTNLSVVSAFSQSNLPACPASGSFTSCFGTYTFPNGWKYVGEFKGSLENGLGTKYLPDGSIGNQGLWLNGNFVRSAPLQQANAPSVMPNSAELDRLNAEVELERKKRQELEQQLATAKERERITAELDQERKKRQELEAQLAATPQPTSPQTIATKRTAHALVIGNGAYPGSGRLDNPVNDANAISQKLRSMGFTVTTVTDANRQRLVQSMAQFRRTAASADISLLYYAGHGVQIFGTNYILPTDVDQTDPAQATIQGVSLNSVVENFLPGKTKLVFLDACRDNALQRTNDRSVSKGLAPISAAEGTLISYATKDGQTAADGVGSKNSPFTQALLEHLNDPQDIAVVLRKVRERVMKITGGKQQPWEYGSLTGGELVLSAIKPK
jgi:hypothetical protein